MYLAGLVLGSATIPARNTITVFHQGFAWVAQIGLFLTLGLLVFPSQLDDVWLEGTVLALVMMFVARPLATVAATIFEGFSAAERVALGWAGLRGGVPVVLATFAVIEDVPGSLEFFNIAFFAVVLSTALQGSTFEPLAKALGLTTDEPALPRPIADSGTIRRLGAEVMEFPVGASDAVVGHFVRELGMPRDALLNVIVRRGEAIPPRGSTQIEAGDRLHVLVRKEVARQFPALMDRWRDGPFEVEQVRRPQVRSGAVIFSTRPWEERDGNPAYPEEIEGSRVIRHLRTRRDRPGALVLLDDGRYAITGPSLAIGAAAQIQRYARRRLSGDLAAQRALLVAGGRGRAGPLTAAQPSSWRKAQRTSSIERPEASAASSFIRAACGDRNPAGIRPVTRRSRSEPAYP